MEDSYPTRFDPKSALTEYGIHHGSFGSMPLQSLKHMNEYMPMKIDKRPTLHCNKTELQKQSSKTNHDLLFSSPNGCLIFSIHRCSKSKRSGDMWITYRLEDVWCTRALGAQATNINLKVMKNVPRLRISEKDFLTMQSTNRSTSHLFF